MRRKGRYTKHSRLSKIKFKLKSWQRAWKGLNWKQKSLIIGGPIVAFLIITPLATYIYFYNDIRDQERLLNRNNTGVVLYDTHDKVIFSTGRAERRDIVKLKNISEDTQHALVAAEDKKFYEHQGFSALGVLRAMYTNIIARSVKGGGSTLTQQLAKNTLLTSKQTFLRKYQELTISMAIEQRYSKEEIMTMYLNSVFFGDNVFGIDEAAKHYFDKKPSQLDLAESAMLIGILPAPNAYSPITGNIEYAKQRQEYVLGRMLEDNYITEDQQQAALDKKLTYAKRSAAKGKAPHFTEMVLDELYDKYGEEKVQRSGYRVKTTLDLKLQQAADQAISDGRAHIEANGGSNAALVAVEPRSGGIRALVGSVDYGNQKFGQVNMATTPRQPGSSYKPLYYADALARGVVTPATLIEDKPTDFGGYKPENATRQYYGQVSVRQALAWSLNIPSVEVLRKDGGADRAIKISKDLGITTVDPKGDYGLAIALGSVEVPLTEMTSAYATYGAGGQHAATNSISEVRDKYDKTVFLHSRTSEQVISASGAYLISNILSDQSARSGMFGSALDVVGTDYQLKNVAVKTGTTDDARDAWTIGYTPDIAVGVWVGNNDHKPMLSGGVDMAGPIWRQTMSAAIGSSSPVFTQPAGVVKLTTCENGRRVTDFFLEANAPEACPEPEKKPNKPVAKCQVEGKESLRADDPECVEPEKCQVEGKESLRADDPDCVEDDDDQEDGSPPDAETPPVTPPITPPITPPETSPVRP